MNTMKAIHIPWWIWIVGNAALAEDTSDFVADLIAEYKLFLPTLIFNESPPNICWTHEGIHCLSNDGVGSQAITEHIGKLQNDRKQDALIIVGDKIHQQLLGDLAHMAPSFFSSNCPVFMPKELSNMIPLRFDSNIIFFEERPDMISMVDKFAVKGGVPITLDLGMWDKLNGFKFFKAKNRWDRRKNLNGTQLVYGLYNPTPGVMVPIKDDQGNIIGSKGFYPEILHAITDALSMSTKAMLIPPGRWRKLKNGTWTGGVGWLQSKKLDACFHVGLKLERASAIDYPIPVIKQAISLMAPIPKGSTMHTWVYVRVFGAIQWAIFLGLLLALALPMAVVIARSRGNKENSVMKDALTDFFSLPYLFALQMGEHPNVNRLKYAMRLLSISLSCLTLLMFIAYNCDITAEFTSGPPEIPVKNFDDVLHHDYKVTTYSPYYLRQLNQTKADSAKHRVYEIYMKEKELVNSMATVKAAFMETLTEPKTLIYGDVGIIGPQSRIDKQLRDQFQPLKINDGSWIITTLALQKDSEFLQSFNYFLLKEFEHGLIKRSYRKGYAGYFTNEEFGISEAYPLAVNNVMALFILLAFGIATSMTIAMMEGVLHLFKRYIGNTANQGNKGNMGNSREALMQVS